MSQVVRECVKCGGLNRRDIDGLVCSNCGQRVWFEAPSFNHRTVFVEPMRAYNPLEKRAIYHVVLQYFDLIAQCRASGLSWGAVGKALKGNGRSVQEKTLMKYFLLEQSKRGGGGEAA